MDKSLAGLTVIITRPAHQAQPLCESISQAGGTVVKFPVIEILPPSNPGTIQSRLTQLNLANLAIFISANAVDAGLNALGGVAHWPEGVPIAAVGRATAAKLVSHGLSVNLVAPEPFNTEALLALPELKNLTEQSIMIFRGEGGRELLAQTLRDRGASVEYVECYRRVIPASDPAMLYQCWDESRDEKRKLLIVVTSNESLKNLVEMVNSEHLESLLASRLLTVSERAVSKASDLGFKQTPVIATAASNEMILEAIQQFSNGNQH